MELPAAKRDYSSQAEDFAQVVRRLRRSGGMTLKELADSSGLSVSTISKIENGQLSPTYESILRLADGLRVDVAQLFSPDLTPVPAQGRRCVTRRRQGRVHPTPQYVYEMLGTELTRKRFVPMVTTVMARGLEEFSSIPRHAGEEFIYVISGCVSLHTEHYEPTLLNPGDSCYFDSSMAHACVSVGEDDAVIIWVTSADGENVEPTGDS